MTEPNEPSWARAPGDSDVTIEANWLFRLRRERFVSRSTGKGHDFFVIHLVDAVNVVAVTTDDQVLLVRQFRAGSGRDSLEPPGGLLDPGEDPVAAAARELKEETGYEGDPGVVIGSAWSNPSILTSRSVTVLITNARLVAEPDPDPEEELAVVLVPAGSIPAIIREGAIDHALSVLALFWWLSGRVSLSIPGIP